MASAQYVSPTQPGMSDPYGSSGTYINRYGNQTVIQSGGRTTYCNTYGNQTVCN